MAEAKRAYEGIDEQDPATILMEKEEQALLIPFPVNGEITHELLMAI